MSDELVNFWSSDNFWQPPRRSWPYAPTKLERLAESMGIRDEELRELLRAEIERRRRGRFTPDGIHEPSGGL